MSGIIYRPMPGSGVASVDIEVQRIGMDGPNYPRYIERPQGVPNLFFLQLHSPGKINGEACSANTSIIWLPDTAHVYGNNQHPWTNSWIHLVGAKAIDLLEARGIPINRPFTLRRPQLFHKYLGLLLDEYRSNMNPDPDILKNIYCNWLIEIERDLAGRDKRLQVPEHILRVKFIVDSQYKRHLSLSILSRECGLSPNYLTSEFRRYFGLSLIDYLISVRISHAQDLLSNVNLPVKLIAAECGFNDIHYFSKLFKKNTGMSPRNYRITLSLSAG